jgi:hypothetical protein
MKGNGHTRPHEESRAQFIVRRMAELGFRPTGAFAADHVEFFKDYADPEGRFARAHVYFDKPVAGVDLRLANFVVSVQKSLVPDRDTVEREAPPVVQADLAEVVSSFQQFTGIPAQSIHTRDCIRCGEPSAEFFVVNGDAVCRDCVEERKTAP